MLVEACRGWGVMEKLPQVIGHPPLVGGIGKCLPPLVGVGGKCHALLG